MLGLGLVLQVADLQKLSKSIVTSGAGKKGWTGGASFGSVLDAGSIEGSWIMLQLQWSE